MQNNACENQNGACGFEEAVREAMDSFEPKDIDACVTHAIMRASFEDGVRAGLEKGLGQGMYDTVEAFDRAQEITKVVHNGNVTIAYFADGCSEKVTYDPSFGYAYDGEKAVMAALLKHLVGNAYLRALKRFEGRGEAICVGDLPVGYSLEGKLNLSRGMVSRLCPCGPEDAMHELPFTDRAPDGTPVNLSDDERLIRELASMDADAFDILCSDSPHENACAVSRAGESVCPGGEEFDILADDSGDGIF